MLKLLLGCLALALLLALPTQSSMNMAMFKQFGLNVLFITWTVAGIALFVCSTQQIIRNLSREKFIAVAYGITALFTAISTLLSLYILSYSAPQTSLFDLAFLVRNVVIAWIVLTLSLRHFHMKEQVQAQTVADSSAKYDALQSRMRPHFLFNSLNTIAQLIHVDQNRAEEALLDLADIFRTTLDKRVRIPLKEELDVTLRYLRMEGLRLGKNRLNIVWDMDKSTLPFEMEIPPLLLQPLVENAIYHGVQPREEGGTLGISLYDASESLDVVVTNPVPPEGTNGHQKGNHIAQENLKKRLRLAYGDRSNLSITKTGHQYRVAFSIPKEQQ